MKKELILKRLGETYKMLCDLKEEEFDYLHYVSKFSDSHRRHGDYCGTICCVAGWYPKYFPDAGLEWNFKNVSMAGALLPDHSIANTVQGTLSLYHGLNDNIITCLFYGYDLKGTTLENWVFTKDYKVSLAEVRDRFADVYHLIVNEEINYKR